ncbi:MAG: hsp70 family protein [Pseudomonadota bacterium]|nr:hsp70 family protein [Pseudomonadota bacterium]
MKPHYIVGIDLGTTHTVVAYAPLTAPGDIALFHIEQLIAPGEVAALPLLPSSRYHPAPGELPASALQLPWSSSTSQEAGTDTSAAPASDQDASQPPAPTPVIGQWARKLGAQVPGRLVSSAKSWLSHAAVDRLAPILPWGAPADVAKVSPIEASASYLRHVRDAWNARFPGSPLAQQELVLTVPASFDEGARALTLTAARQAGLPKLRLLEEPQAVFYDWLLRHRARLAQELAQTRLVLVCDVGGGTTDLSLIKVELDDGQPRLTRIAVGQHLMLGGDNMDLALAHAVEARMASSAGDTPAAPLSAGCLAQLMERCRTAKELLLAADAPEQTPVTLLGGGARLIGASRSVMLTRHEVEHLIVDGFFPQVEAGAQVRQSRSGIVAFGLPYARDAAITRHIAEFLRQHGQLPDTLLLNGGVFRAETLVRRLADTLGNWRGAPLRLLHNDNPDVAVARGAVAYGLAQRGEAPKIGGGAARSYFLLLDEKTAAARRGQGEAAPAPRGICILPRGSEPGQEIVLAHRTFALRLGQPVRFHLLTSLADGPDHAPPQPGELVTLAPDHFAHLPPIVTVVQAPDASASAAGPAAESAAAAAAAATATAGAKAADRPAPHPAAATRRQDIPVQLVTSLTEVGTLEMHCVNLADPGQRWRLEFDLRHADSAAAPETSGGQDGQGGGGSGNAPAAGRLRQAIEKIDRVFGIGQPATTKEVRQLRAQLEQVLGARESWTTPELRQLFDALWQRARTRRRSAEHERVWLNLAGYCLRPGFGDPLDGWRLQQLWPIFPAGVQHSKDRQACAEWWTLWRRVAGGLDAAQQLRLLDDFAFNLQNNRDSLDADGPPPVKGSDEDMLRLGASLERIPADYKAEIGEWLLGRLQAAPTAQDTAGDSLTLWTLGRIGARQPVYGSSHDVVPPETVARWLQTLLALDWRRLEAAAFAAVSLARVTDDRSRDLPLALRESVMARLKTSNAPPVWSQMLREKVELDAATERRVLGESLPPGLKLMA